MQINEISPHLEEVIHWLNRLGYTTVDSGDGSNYAEGMEGALPYDHIAIITDPDNLIEMSDRLRAQLDSRGCSGVAIEGTYDPRDQSSLILIVDLDNTKQLRAACKVDSIN